MTLSLFAGIGIGCVLGFLACLPVASFFMVRISLRSVREIAANEKSAIDEMRKKFHDLRSESEGGIQ